jgi:hypothetical protein
MTPGPGRRAVLALAGLGGVAASRAAQSQPARVVAWPVPCGANAAEFAGLVIEGRGATTAAVAVFGTPFAPGEVPRGAGLAARLQSGGAVPAQLDVVTRHPDGSARFGVVAIASPALRGSEAAGIVLRRSPANEPPLDAQIALARRRAVLSVGSPGGRGWQVDLSEMARRAIASRRGLWQSGPLAVQVRVVRPVPPEAVGGATSLRCVADIAIHADGTLRIEAWLRNDIAMRPGGGRATYDMRLEVDGRTVLAAEGIRQALYTGWGRSVAVGPDGAPAAEAVHLRQDSARLATIGVVARFDLSSGIAETTLQALADQAARPDWSVPLGPRGLAQDMFAPGGRPDLGPVTESQAIWLMTGDPRAAAHAIGQAEAAGAVPWHMWDPAGDDGGAPGGGWLDTRRWPTLWSDPRGRRPPAGLLQPVPDDTGWAADTAHQPDLSYVPYLMTGRRAFLDGLQAQAAWSVMSRAPNQWERGTPRRGAPGEGVNVARGHQVRGAAWCLRQLGNAAWAGPAGIAGPTWVEAAEQGNWAWIRSRIPDWTRQQGEAHGWIPGVYGIAGALPPWQQDMFASAALAAARRGQPDARAVLAWMENFLAGRFLAAQRGFNPRDGCAYLLAIAPERADPPPYTSWATIGAETARRDWSNRDGWSKSQGNFAQYALQTLAGLTDVLGSEKARRARAWLVAAAPPFTGPGQFDPALSIVPAPGRGGAAEPACRGARPRVTGALPPTGRRAN